MSELKALQLAWRSFTTDRAADKRGVITQIDKNNAEITRLRDENQTLMKEFTDKWERIREERKVALDVAAKAELAKGTSAQAVLRELGSNNTKWIYELRSEVVDQFGNVGKGVKKPAKEEGPVEDDVIEGIKWLHHDEERVHRYLVDTSRNYFKYYGAPDTPFVGDWFVADMQHNFVAGSKALYDSSKTDVLAKHVTMLTRLLDGEYKGKIKLSKNGYVN